MVRPANIISMDTLFHFIYYQISSFVRSGAAENSMMVDETFYTSTDGSFGRNITGREGKSLSVSLLVRAKHCFFHNGSNAT